MGAESGASICVSRRRRPRRRLRIWEFKVEKNDQHQISKEEWQTLKEFAMQQHIISSKVYRCLKVVQSNLSDTNPTARRAAASQLDEILDELLELVDNMGKKVDTLWGLSDESE
jgi:hypothetical protein